MGVWVGKDVWHVSTGSDLKESMVLIALAHPRKG